MSRGEIEDEEWPDGWIPLGETDEGIENTWTRDADGLWTFTHTERWRESSPMSRGEIESMPRICTPETAPYWTIVDVIRQELGDDRDIREEVDTQMICLTEEVGEVARAWRRFTGRARVTEDLKHVYQEVADIIITARVTMLMLGGDPDQEVREKLLTIVERGGR